MSIKRAVKEYWEKSGRKALAVIEKKIEIKELKKKLKQAQDELKKLEQQKQ